MRALILVALIALSGCTTVTQDQIDSDSPAFLDLNLADARRCVREFGHQLGTPGYQECVFTLKSHRMQQSAALGRVIQAQQRPQPRFINCRSHQQGVFTNTTCQ